MSKESLYDDTLSQFIEYEEHKDNQKAKTKRKKADEAALVRAGRPSTTAALGRMAMKMAEEQDENESEDEERVVKRRRLRQGLQRNRKAATMSLALQPICECLNSSVQANQKMAEDEAKRFNKQTTFENKMSAIFAAAAAKTANLPVDVKLILQLVDLT